MKLFFNSFHIFFSIRSLACFRLELQWNMKLWHSPREELKIMTFLISFFAIEIFSILLLIHFFHNFFCSSSSSLIISHLFPFLRLSIKIFLALGIECICRWMNVWWDFVLLESCLLRAISFPFILKLDLKGERRILCFMYSCYVISSFLITRIFEEILFHSAYVRMSEMESKTVSVKNN